MKQFPAFPPSMPSIAPVTAAQVETKLASTKALMLGVVGTLAVGAALAQPASDRVTWLMPEIDAAVSVPTPGGSGARSRIVVEIPALGPAEEGIP